MKILLAGTHFCKSQEDLQFKASLGYMRKPASKIQKTNPTTKNYYSFWLLDFQSHKTSIQTQAFENLF
jgi:hypothetical protein